MSSVTNIMIFSGEIAENFRGGRPEVEVFNEKLREWDPTYRQEFAQTEEWYGGKKRLEVRLIGGAFDGFACEDQLVAFFLERDWEFPEEAVLVIHPQEGEALVYRPAY